MNKPVTSPLAVISLLLGLVALAPIVLILAGIPALLLGYVSLRLIHQSEGRLRGVLPAVIGMILGGLATLVSLSGFLIGAVLEARETANRAECRNNLRIIGECVGVFEDKNRNYPPGTVPVQGLSPDRRPSWLASIRPYLRDAARPSDTGPAKSLTPMKLDQAWDATDNRAAVDASIRDFLCPSYDGRPAPGTPGLTTYIGIAGIGADAATLPLDDAKAGFFGYDRILTRKSLQEMRGEARTIMVMETAFDVGPWAAGGPSTVRGLDPATQPYIGPRRPWGGLHRTGLFVLFADGSTTFFRNEFEAAKLEALVLIHQP